jgi:pyruvate kinase
MAFPKTKIVCTIGPASNTLEQVCQLIESGMSVARLNFSHGNHEDHGAMIDIIRKASEQTKRPVAILQDLCGPKIRVGEIPGDGLMLAAGNELVLATDGRPAQGNRVSVSLGDLPNQVKAGDRILLADGFMELTVRVRVSPIPR